jgi:hypothetical protein
VIQGLQDVNYLVVAHAQPYNQHRSHYKKILFETLTLKMTHTQNKVKLSSSNPILDLATVTTHEQSVATKK